MTETILYIGTEPRMWRSEAVLKYSIQKHAEGPVTVHSMDYSAAGDWAGWHMGRPPGEPATRDKTAAGEEVWFTDFTNFRWAVPEICGFKGRAIYLDVDIALCADIAKLFALPIPKGKGILSLSAQETSVMLINCAYFAKKPWWPRLADMKTNGWSIQRYRALLEEHDAFAPLPPEWNCLDGAGYDEDATCLIHYTDMSSHIWLPYPERLRYRRHPSPRAEQHWMTLYEEADTQGALPSGPPPEGALPPGVGDAFLSFLDLYRSERHWESLLPGLAANKDSPEKAEQGTDDTPPVLLAGVPAVLMRQPPLTPYIAPIGDLLKAHGVSTLLDCSVGTAPLYHTDIAIKGGPASKGLGAFWGVTCSLQEPGLRWLLPAGESYDGVLCAHVLNRVAPRDVQESLMRLLAVARKFVFVVITLGRTQAQPRQDFADDLPRDWRWWRDLLAALQEQAGDRACYLVLEQHYPSRLNPGTVYAKTMTVQSSSGGVQVLQ